MQGWKQYIAASVVTASVASTFAATVPYTESFGADASNWRNSAGAANATYVSAGGSDGGGFVQQAFSFGGFNVGDTPVMVRGQSNFGSSGNNFFGNWLTEGVTEFHAYVRHDAPVPINFFARFARNPAPGAVAVAFAPVLPNTWTEITIGIDPANPQFVSFEGSDFGFVFSDIQRLQLGVSVPAGLPSTASYNFDFDQISITPEPSSLVLLLLGAIATRRTRV